MKKLEITTRLSFKDYLKLNYYVLLNSTIGVLIAVLILAFILSIPHLISNKEFAKDSVPIATYIFPFIFLVILPLATYFKAKANYNNPNLRFSESITYYLDKDWIKLIGESFETKFDWNKLLKVVETKNWFLIYQNKASINMILKKDMQPHEFIELRAIIRSAPKLKFSQTKKVTKELYLNSKKTIILKQQR